MSGFTHCKRGLPWSCSCLCSGQWYCSSLPNCFQYVSLVHGPSKTRLVVIINDNNNIDNSWKICNSGSIYGAVVLGIFALLRFY